MKIKKNSVISVAQCHTVFYTVSHSENLKKLCDISCTVSHSVLHRVAQWKLKKTLRNSAISVAQCHTVLYSVAHSENLKKTLWYQLHQVAQWKIKKTLWYSVSNSVKLCDISCTVSHSVELNPHARITLSKIPILSVIQELFAKNTLDMRKESGLIPNLREAGHCACSWVWKRCP